MYWFVCFVNCMYPMYQHTGCAVTHNMLVCSYITIILKMHVVYQHMYLSGLIDISSSFNECLHYVKMSFNTCCVQWTTSILQLKFNYDQVLKHYMLSILHTCNSHTCTHSSSHRSCIHTKKTPPLSPSGKWDKSLMVKDIRTTKHYNVSCMWRIEEERKNNQMPSLVTYTITCPLIYWGTSAITWKWNSTIPYLIHPCTPYHLNVSLMKSMYMTPFITMIYSTCNHSELGSANVLQKRLTWSLKIVHFSLPKKVLQDLTRNWNTFVSSFLFFYFWYLAL